MQEPDQLDYENVPDQAIYGNEDMIEQPGGAGQETYGNEDIIAQARACRDEPETDMGNDDDQPMYGNVHFGEQYHDGEQLYMPMDGGAQNIDDDDQINYVPPTEVTQIRTQAKPPISQKPVKKGQFTINPNAPIVAELQAIAQQIKLQSNDSAPVVPPRSQSEEEVQYDYSVKPQGQFRTAEEAPSEVYADNNVTRPSEYAEAQTVAQGFDDGIYENLPRKGASSRKYR